MQTRGHGRSHPGVRREENEDRLLVDDALGLYAVCDGMGGHQAGEVASTLAVETLGRVVQEATVHGVVPHTALQATVERAITEACRAVWETATSERGHAGMGCTLTMLLTSGERAVMGHVGDTRLYLLRDGVVHQLSSDHTMAAELARSGAIRPDEVRTHAYAHVLTRAVGVQPAVQAETLALDLFPGDRFLLCSDGLSDYLAGPEQVAASLASEPFAEIPQSLVAFACQSGGKDNVSAVVVELVGHFDPDTTNVETRMSLAAVSETPLFDADILAHLVRLVAAGDHRSFAAGEFVLERGALAAALYIPMRGTLEVTGPGGRTRVITRGDVIGESTLLHPRPSRATVRAIEPSTVLVVDADHVRQLVRMDAGVGLSLLEQLGRYLSQRLERATGVNSTEVDL